MPDIDKLGVFYLGRELDAAGRPADGQPVLYDARDLTTHGVIVGMTGSGKTGLAMALVEEAALDGIPSILIDPKGDLGNLLLAFPDLQPSDFRPWMDEAQAAREGVTPDALAARTAETWRRGLADWGQDGARVRRFCEAAERAIYTPGSAAGRPLCVLRSLTAPRDAVADGDDSALRDRILSTVSGLLGLLGIAADPIRSRDHILLSSLLERAWREGRDLDLETLIAAIQKPPFEKVGVFDLESFYPAKDRFGLAMALNNLVASPGFAAWRAGEPLDVQRLLFTADGRPRLSVISIAHLSDPERMFFVTLLLGEVLAWARRQPGTGSLRALLYMDEIFGYFPPTANPPSKVPMLTLLKQARAFGLGVVLSTQNPVDLDYKGLANAGTWWIGRLLTDRDRLRVLDGLEGAQQASGAAFDRASIEPLLAGLGNRVFLMRNVNDDRPTVFQSRWALTYLRGPMTLAQIRQAAGNAPAAPAASPAPSFAPAVAPAPAPAAPAATPPPAGGARPAVPPDVPEYFLRPRDPAAPGVYRASVVGVAQLHFVDAKAGVDQWETYGLLAPLGEDGFPAWDRAERLADPKTELGAQPAPGIAFAPPLASIRARNADGWKKTFAAHLYQNVVLEGLRCPALKLAARPGEREGDFRARVALAGREARDAEVARLRANYAPKLQTLTDQLRRAREREEREKSQASQQKLHAALGVGATLLGALLGRRAASVGTITRATTTLRSASRIAKESRDAAAAGQTVAVLEERLHGLEQQFEQDAAALQQRADPASAIDKMPLRPRKSDITIGAVGLCWAPGAGGAA